MMSHTKELGTLPTKSQNTITWTHLKNKGEKMKRNYKVEYQFKGVSHFTGSFVLEAKSEEDAKERGKKTLASLNLKAEITGVTKV